jgi:selenocysteine lyase/cysteine desulfurase
MNRREFLHAFGALGLIPLQQNSSPSTYKPQEFIWPENDDANYWEKLREQFYIPKDEAFFNNGTLGACPKSVLETVANHMRQIEETLAHWDYKPENPTWFSGYTEELSLRKKLAQLVGAKESEIGVTQNATMGMNFLALGLTLQPGDVVLSTDQEHPGGRCGWEMRAQREGIIFRTLEVPIPPKNPEEIVQLFTESITDRTRVITLPHITSRYGFVMPVHEICKVGKQYGIFTIVDGAQAVGQIPVNLKEIGCDAYFSSPHKWLLAPPGNGLLYIREAKQNEVWTTLASSSWNDYQKGLFRFMQYGTGNLSLLKGLEAAVDFYNRIGPDRVFKRIIQLANHLRSGLREINRVTLNSSPHPAMAAAITNYSVRGIKAVNLQDELWKRKKIRIRAVGDDDVRHSVHLYNNESEIDDTLDIIQSL